MRARYREVPSRFGPQRRSRLARQGAELERLKGRMLAARLDLAPGARFQAQLKHTAGDAAALAWATRYPLLLFPGLFEEMADAAFQRVERQEQVLQRSQELLAA